MYKLVVLTGETAALLHVTRWYHAPRQGAVSIFVVEVVAWDAHTEAG